MFSHVVVMSKPAVVGRVKTRLIGRFSAHQATGIHRAMLQCVLDRVDDQFAADKRVRRVLAMDYSFMAKPEVQLQIQEYLPKDWVVVDQGVGDLTQRMIQVSQTVGTGPIAFLGIDSPDVPADVLRSILLVLESSDLAVGPVHDGGYWTLSARQFDPRLVTGIDWGTDRVYHQTAGIAQETGLSMARLTKWFDVDQPQDVELLRQRIAQTNEPALDRLRSRLDHIMQG